MRASVLGLRGARTERIRALCEAVGADTYLSGRGGSLAYVDTALLARAGITTRWQRFTHPSYPQRYSRIGFVSHLAFLDILFNWGPYSTAILWGTPPPVAVGTTP